MSKRSSLSMYVIATVFCSNFHFSVSLHVPFSQFLFERDSYSNEYLVFTCKIWRRYSRGRASQSLPKISQKLEKKLPQKVRKNLGLSDSSQELETVRSAAPSRSRKREPPVWRPAAQLTTGACRPGRPAHEPNRFRQV